MQAVKRGSNVIADERFPRTTGPGDRRGLHSKGTVLLRQTAQ
jgi:hypothetical protein